VDCEFFPAGMRVVRSFGGTKAPPTLLIVLWWLVPKHAGPTTHWRECPMRTIRKTLAAIAIDVRAHRAARRPRHGAHPAAASPITASRGRKLTKAPIGSTFDHKFIVAGSATNMSRPIGSRPDQLATTAVPATRWKSSIPDNRIELARFVPAEEEARSQRRLPFRSLLGRGGAAPSSPTRAILSIAGGAQQVHDIHDVCRNRRPCRRAAGRASGLLPSVTVELRAETCRARSRHCRSRPSGPSSAS
jgi:hypothetical protein